MRRFSFIRTLVACYGLFSISLVAFAQSRQPHPFQVLVSPDRSDWTYRPGDEATFTIRILKHHVPMEEAEVSYTVGPEKMAPASEGKLKLKKGVATVKGKLTQAGFLQCQVRIAIDGANYRGLATVGYAPETIQPTQSMPDDFWDFWNKAKAEAAKVPMDARLTLLPERCTEKVDVYQVNVQNFETGTRLYGILAKPKAPGRYPAALQVPGAGIRPYGGIIDLAEKGVISLQIGIHGVPVTYETALYNDMAAGPLKGYPFFNLDDRDKYYFKRVYLGCVRAVDFLCSLPEFDGNNLVVWGGSQGGALAIVTAALDSRVKGLVSMYPALCDLTGYLHGRAGGWPHMFKDGAVPSSVEEEKIKVSAYYDVVNFARSVNVPGFYSWGYNDETCPPTSYYAAYNQIKAPRELYLVQETGHWTYPEQHVKTQAWLLATLGID